MSDRVDGIDYETTTPESLKETTLRFKDNRCSYCRGIGVLIDRFDHSRFYDCPACEGKKKIRVIQTIPRKER